MEFKKEEGEDGEDILQGMVMDVRSMLKDAEKANGRKGKATKSAGVKKGNGAKKRVDPMRAKRAIIGR